MKLKCMVVADPKRSAAELTADQCERLASRREITTTTNETIARVEALEPELLLLSLELPKLDPLRAVPALRQRLPKLFVIATYRELSLPRMKKLSEAGVEEFIAQPVDIIQVYRAASARFRTSFRRHDRYALSLDVVRADGVVIGKTIDLSEGGLRMEAVHPMTPGESILVDLALPDGPKPLRVRCQLLHVDGQAPAKVTVRAQFVNLWGPEHRRLVNFLGTQTPIADARPA
jgi:CheY-like chemotaxis protein